MSNSDQTKPDGIYLTPNHASARPQQEAVRPRSDTSLQAFIGGTPGAVFVRLAIASLVVGFFLVWLDIRPYDVFRGLEHFAMRIWDMGFDAIREVGQYVLAGAAVVLPIWFLSRLMKFGGH